MGSTKRSGRLFGRGSDLERGDKALHSLDRLGKVLFVGAARTRARFERMVAVRDPCDTNGAREFVLRDFFGQPKRIARALNDQRGRAQLLKMRGAKARRRSGRMKRITETDQTGDPGLIGDHRSEERRVGK